MNNKGFAITGIVYAILVLFILTLIGLLTLFNSRRAVLDELKNKVLGDVTVKIDLSPIMYREAKAHEFTAQVRGYYQIELTSGKTSSNTGKTLSTQIYLKKGETLYFIVGSSNYNSGNTEIRTNPNNSSTVIARSSSLNTSIYLPDKFEDRDFINTEIKTGFYNNSSYGWAKITYLSREKENTDLNKVRYIKDCIDGNSKDNGNHWVEIKAIVDGVNKAYQKNVTGNLDDYKLITDGIVDNSKYASSISIGNQCVVVDLESPYNVDEIIVWHNYGDDRTYYSNVVSTSLDGINYTPIHAIEKKETYLGNVISAYEESTVLLVGNVYVPVKTFDSSKWARVFHHNNKNGTIFWTSTSQALTTGGYDVKHRQSILYNLEEFKNDKGEFEFLLEYSELTGYNRWTQTSNPVTTSNKVNDYVPVNIDFDDSFSGLNKSTSSGILIDGSIGSDSYYTIGATRSWNGGIAGPISYDNSIKDTVDLWVRIDILK